MCPPVAAQGLPANERSNGIIGKVQLLSFVGESVASEPYNLAFIRGSLSSAA